MTATPLIPLDKLLPGAAYAAHILRHAVGVAHQPDVAAYVATIPDQLDPSQPLSAVPRLCCRAEVYLFATSMAAGLEKLAGTHPDHTHPHDDDYFHFIEREATVPETADADATTVDPEDAAAECEARLAVALQTGDTGQVLRVLGHDLVPLVGDGDGEDPVEHALLAVFTVAADTWPTEGEPADPLMAAVGRLGVLFASELTAEAFADGEQ